MVILIHNNNTDFSRRWITYCKEKGLCYKIANCCDSNIIQELKTVDILLWHWQHGAYEDVKIARDIIRAAEIMGIKTFPSTSTCWTFDNKIAQKYILEAIDAPLIPTYVFFDKEDALDWLNHTSLPKVFKLARGAGSRNVYLVRNMKAGKAFINRAFGRGFKTVSAGAMDAVKKIQHGTTPKTEIIGKIKRLPKTLMSIYRSNKFLGREKGYAYFQDFIPDNKFDIRITVIGNRAFGFTRNVRKDDFRASGSGSIDYSKDRIPQECLRTAFDVSKKLDTQSIAFDFLLDSSLRPLIGEISYAYLSQAIYNCLGFWDNDLKWHEGQLWPQDAILSDILQEIKKT